MKYQNNKTKFADPNNTCFIALLTNNTGFGPGFQYSDWQTSSRDQKSGTVLTDLPVRKSVLLA